MAPTSAQASREDRSSSIDLALPPSVLVLLIGLVFAAVRQGAYHQWQHQVFAFVVLFAGALQLLDKHHRAALGWGLLVMAPLFASSLISALLSNDRSDAPSTFLTIGLVAIALGAGASTTREDAITALDGVLLVSMIVAVTAIVGVATHEAPWGRITEGIWRGSSSLTYANAAAAVVGPVALLTFCRAAQDGRRLHAAATVILLIAMASTQSRGGALAFLALTPLVVTHLGIYRAIRSSLPVVGGVALGTPLLLLRAPTAETPQPILIAAGIGLGVAVTCVTWSWKDRVRHPGWIFAGAVLTCVLVVVATGAASSMFERVTLRSGTTAGGEDAEVLFGDRGKEWATAVDRIEEEPLFGHGPGVVDLSWTEDGRSFRAYFVHNEYLELAVTHGVLGVVALAASVWLWVQGPRQHRKNVPMLIAIGAFLLHSALDFLWHLPALPVLFGLLAGLAVSSPKAVLTDQRTSGRHDHSDRR